MGTLVMPQFDCHPERARSLRERRIRASRAKRRVLCDALIARLARFPIRSPNQHPRLSPLPTPSEHSHKTRPPPQLPRTPAASKSPPDQSAKFQSPGPLLPHPRQLVHTRKRARKARPVPPCRLPLQCRDRGEFPHPSTPRCVPSPPRPLPATPAKKPEPHPTAVLHDSKLKSPPLLHPSRAAHHHLSAHPSPQSALAKSLESTANLPMSPPTPLAPH